MRSMLSSLPAGTPRLCFSQSIVDLFFVVAHQDGALAPLILGPDLVAHLDGVERVDIRHTGQLFRAMTVSMSIGWVRYISPCEGKVAWWAESMAGSICSTMPKVTPTARRPQRC
jgi:hypothetical protein